MISEERLLKALQIYENALLASLPEPEACVHTFSPQFERKMKRLSRKVSHLPAQRVLSRAAGFLLAFLLTGTIWLSVDTAAREAVFGWFRTVYETVFVYRFHGEEPADLQTYRPTWLPEDWVEIDSWTEDTSATIVYLDSNEHYGYFDYALGNQGTASVIYGAEDPLSVTVGGIAAELYLPAEGYTSSTLTWIDTNDQILFSISGDLPQEDLIRIAESVICTG